MKKILLIILLFVLNFLPVFAKTDRTSAEYLKNNKHISVFNPIAENAAQSILKKALKKKVGSGDYKVRFSAYTLFSLRRGIFKSIEIEGKNVEIEDIPVPYIKVKTITDYNWIDITQKPPIVKPDMVFDFSLELTEKSINAALKHKEYQDKLKKLNARAYPLFEITDVRVKIRHDKVHIIMDYNLPLATNRRVKTFVVSANFKVDNGQIKASNIGFDNTYGNLPIEKVVNLINLINPLSFTMTKLNENHCKGQIESVNIEDNIAQVSGKIFITKYKGE